MPEGTQRRAIVLPGANFGPMAGLLAYAWAAVFRRGAAVELATWPSDWAVGAIEEREPLVREHVAGMVSGKDVLLIGKSMGSLAASIAADQRLPAIWLTPLLTVPSCADALGRAERPFMLIGGTSDPWWDGRLARQLTPHVVEVDGADHGMLVPGPLSDSAYVLSQVVAALESFLDDVVWATH